MIRHRSGSGIPLRIFVGKLYLSNFVHKICSCLKKLENIPSERRIMFLETKFFCADLNKCRENSFSRANILQYLNFLKTF
jgi:hypothetical protein